MCPDPTGSYPTQSLGPMEWGWNKDEANDILFPLAGKTG